MANNIPAQTTSDAEIIQTSRFDLDSLTEYTNDALLQELRRVAGLHERGPFTSRAFGRLSPKVSLSTVLKRFGTWRKALSAAGLSDLNTERHSGSRHSEEAIVQEIQRVAATHEQGPFTSRVFTRLSPQVAVSTIFERFGTWENALSAAGLPSLRTERYAGTRYTDEQCFENLAAVWTHYGRPPRLGEMKLPPSKVGPTAYLRWGTWRKGLKAFVDWTTAETTISLADLNPFTKPSEEPVLQEIRKTEPDRREVKPGLRFKVFKRDHFRCLACGRSPATDLTVELHADHIVSVYDGGRTTYENLQTLCQACNLGKGRTSIR